MYPFEQFTQRARAVLSLAQQEAEAAGHSYIGTEHLLLGLLREADGLARQLLNGLGVEIEPVREAISARLATTRHVAGDIVPTSRVKNVIEIAFEEARRMGHSYVGTEHLLLGLLVEGEGIAANVLLEMGVTLDTVKAKIERLITERGVEPQGPPPTHVQHTTVALPMGADLRRLMTAASGLAGRREARVVGLDHLLDAMISSAGIEALARLLDVRRHAAAKEQAVASQDYEAASGHRTAERQAKQALDQAIAAWRQELEPPARDAS